MQVCEARPSMSQQNKKPQKYIKMPSKRPTDRPSDLIQLINRPDRDNLLARALPGDGNKNKCPCEVKIHKETKEKSKPLHEGQGEELAAWRLRFCKLMAFCHPITPPTAFDADDGDDDDGDVDAGTNWSMRILCLISALAVVFHVP